VILNPRQFRRAPECVGRKRVFSGYGEPTAAWHGTSSPTVPWSPSLRRRGLKSCSLLVRTEVRAFVDKDGRVCIKHFPSIIKKKKKPKR